MTLLSLGSRPFHQAGVGQDPSAPSHKSISSTAGAEIVSDKSERQERGIAPFTVIDSPALGLECSNHFPVFGWVPQQIERGLAAVRRSFYSHQFSLTYFSARHMPQNGRLGVNRLFPTSVRMPLPLRVFCQSFCQNMLIRAYQSSGLGRRCGSSHSKNE